MSVTRWKRTRSGAGFGVWRVALSSFVLMVGIVPAARAQLGTDFRQAANEDPVLGDIIWTSSILQQNNSRYYEGMSVPQRLIFVNIPATTGNVHTLSFSHQANKSTAHAIDFITSWEQAVSAAQLLTTENLLDNLFVEACDGAIGPQATVAICNSLRSSAYTTLANVPDSIGFVLADNVDTRIAAYEVALGNRTVKIYGNQPITAASMTFTGLAFSLESAPDVDAHYTLSWTSASDQVLIELGGHLAVGDDNATGVGIGYGTGKGSSAISGGPYHFKLSYLDGSSLGSQDNQIKGADIIAPFCLPGSCDDGIPCTIDTCDEANDLCINTPDDTVCSDGLFCSGSETCDQTLGCQAGTPPNCDDGIPCTADSCDEVNDTCVHTPGHAVCSDGLYCNGTEVCDPLLGCQSVAPPNCDDGVGCTVDACNEATDSCDHTLNHATCNDGQYCNGTEYCDPINDCHAGTPPACGDGVGCTVDSCDEVNDVCVNAPDTGLCDDGLYCNGSETCDALLDCQAGIPPNCNDGVSCTADSCNEATDSCDHVASNVLCDDGAYCNGTETCDPLNGCQIGTPPNCNDTIGCTVDSCDEVNDTCTHTPNHAGCDDGQYCNGTETCDALLGCQAGTAPNCDDGVGCTFDACNEVTDTCTHTPQNSACSDGLYCTGAETCDPVNDCQAGTPPNCNDGVSCTVDSCNEGTDSCDHVASNALCDDGLYCSGVETCDAVNDCQAGTPPNCNDGVSCTIDSCNETTNSCDHAASDALCDDAQYCNGSETCDALNGCQSGTPINCSDGVGCTVDSCDEINNVCVHTPNSSGCDDGQFCNGVETCDPVLGCLAGTPPNCGDGVGCTLDACNEANDTCTHTPKNSACSDGLYCTGVETCDPVNDCQAGTPVDCNDGVSCTVDACNETTDSCDNTATNSLCDDGAYCNGSETCDANNDCQAGIAPNCNDGVPCTVDSCDEVNDTCVNAADDGRCDDGAYCNGGETCDPANGCQAGTPVHCGDGVPCTVDVCDEVNDTCVNTPNDGNCSDSQYCNGAETCDPVAGCQAGTAPNCDDGVACTDDACDEVNDTCVSIANNANCNDGLFCNGTETCDAVGDCQPGTAPNCDDGVGCTYDWCDELNDTCVNDPDDSVCDDALYCTGVETCDPLNDCQPGGGDPCPPLLCDELLDACVQCLDDVDCDDGLYCNGSETCVNSVCQAGTPPNCNDGVGCTVDSCDEVNDVCVNAPSNGRCNDGAHCNGVETCDALLDCQPGVAPNCDDGVGCTVDTCDEVNDVCVHAPSNAACTDGEYCNGLETCHALLDCQAGAPPNCNDGVGCTVDSCDEINDICINTAQNSLCDDGAWCNGAETCDPLNDCQAGTPPNCNDGIGCTVDSCDETNDVCVNTTQDSLCDDGQYCNGSETCDPLLGCLAGTAPICNDGVGCTVDSCNETTDTCDNVPTNSLCNDGQYCNGVETCNALLDCVAGPAPNCDDNVGCTADACDEVNDTCVNTVDDAACDDGAWCNGTETCDSQNDCQAGTPPNCNDGVGCTVDSCDEVNDVCVNMPQNSLCDDSQHCNGVETCDPVNDCQAGTPPNCNDGVGCTVDNCNETTDSCDNVPTNSICDDSQYCNGAETCDALLGCQGGTAPICDDNVDCTVDSCDEVNDRCVNAPSNAFCNDGQFCNGTETCDALNDCQAGTPPNCNDGVGCTVDSCNETTDSCDHAASNSLCNDGQFCNGTEFCDPVNDCQSGAAPNCNDGVGCTVDGCDEVNDLCVHIPNNGRCDDTLYCNGSETCDVVDDCQSGTPPNCSDGVGCTNDSCNEDTDSCDHVPVPALCDDAQFCNGIEICDTATGCGAGPPPDCNDDVSCTVDSCNEANDLCVHTVSDKRCDDGLWCNGAETCDPGDDCQAGTPIDCGDGVSCTIDVCDEDIDACIRTPSDGVCNDGVFCNGVESCDAVNDCQPGTPPVCDDQIGCTNDSCNSALDGCEFVAVDDKCDDGDACTADSCDADAGCVNTLICGACCDRAPGLGGVCESTVAEADCQGAYQVWTYGATCAEVTCQEIRGACCDSIVGNCQVTLQTDCVGPNRIWTPDVACAEVTCDPIPGACCNHLNPDPLAAEGICTDGVTQSACQGDHLTWTKGVLCSSVPCDPVFQVIPTISEWGLVVLALMLLIGAKLYYGRRECNVA